MMTPLLVSRSAVASLESLMRHSAVRRTVLAAYVTAMAVSLLIPLPDPPSFVPSNFDKAVHAGMFLGFAALAAWNMRGGWVGRMLMALGIAALVAALVELIQAPLPYRSCDPVDFLTGVAGAVLGAVVGAWLTHPDA